MKKIILFSAFICLGTYSFGQTKNSSQASDTTVRKSRITKTTKENFGDVESAMGGMMNSFGPMITKMTMAAMDAQLEYYKQPGKLAEVAKLTKEYYDALRKEGFSYDDALKIVVAGGLLPKPAPASK